MAILERIAEDAKDRKADTRELKEKKKASSITPEVLEEVLQDEGDIVDFGNVEYEDYENEDFGDDGDDDDDDKDESEGEKKQGKRNKKRKGGNKQEKVTKKLKTGNTGQKKFTNNQSNAQKKQKN